MTSKKNIPKDLKIKIGSETEAMWTQVRDNAETQLKQAEGTIILQKAVLELAEKKIIEEKAKFK